ncbi:MAG TPA: ssl1498 family light-harvesting-like protein [Kamptonema sp.]|nr:ssl1498 family light-harvesting-like protein [Kamptonema sp.]
MYTTDNEGLLNNYSVEPPVYFADYPSTEQQQRYKLQGAVAFLLVGLLSLVALSIH